MDGPHLIHGSQPITTDATLRRDLEASVRAISPDATIAALAILEGRLSDVESTLKVLVDVTHTLSTTLGDMTVTVQKLVERIYREQP